jgi:hypothetical protein
MDQAEVAEAAGLPILEACQKHEVRSELGRLHGRANNLDKMVMQG